MYIAAWTPTTCCHRHCHVHTQAHLSHDCRRFLRQSVATGSGGRLDRAGSERLLPVPRSPRAASRQRVLSAAPEPPHLHFSHCIVPGSETIPEQNVPPGTIDLCWNKGSMIFVTSVCYRMCFSNFNSKADAFSLHSHLRRCVWLCGGPAVDSLYMQRVSELCTPSEQLHAHARD